MLTVIPPKLFNGCTVLETVEIPENIKEVSMSAFDNCNELQVDIPEKAVIHN